MAVMDLLTGSFPGPTTVIVVTSPPLPVLNPVPSQSEPDAPALIGRTGERRHWLGLPPQLCTKMLLQRLMASRTCTTMEYRVAIRKNGNKAKQININSCFPTRKKKKQKGQGQEKKRELKNATQAYKIAEKKERHDTYQLRGFLLPVITLF